MVQLRNEIALSEDIVTIKSEFYNAERTIHIGMTEHPEDVEPTVQGHSIGWWEGQTLVVDTRFSPSTAPRSRT